MKCKHSWRIVQRHLSWCKQCGTLRETHFRNGFERSVGRNPKYRYYRPVKARNTSARGLR
jgi:hypothetical protein